MPRTRKEGLLESLDEIDGDLQSRKGKESFDGKNVTAEVEAEERHEPDAGESANAEVEKENPEDPGSVEGEKTPPEDGTDVVKEVEEHLIASGQWDCPHCGGAMKVKE